MKEENGNKIKIRKKYESIINLRPVKFYLKWKLSNKNREKKWNLRLIK